jgi:hypothetical protein
MVCRQPQLGIEHIAQVNDHESLFGHARKGALYGQRIPGEDLRPKLGIHQLSMSGAIAFIDQLAEKTLCVPVNVALFVSGAVNVPIAAAPNPALLRTPTPASEFYPTRCFIHPKPIPSWLDVDFAFVAA